MLGVVDWLFGFYGIRLVSVISRTLIGGGSLTPLQRCSRRFLQPQPTGQEINIWRFKMKGEYATYSCKFLISKVGEK